MIINFVFIFSLALLILQMRICVYTLRSAILRGPCLYLVGNRIKRYIAIRTNCQQMLLVML